MSERDRQPRISDPYLLAVEGKDEENFFQKLLAVHGIDRVAIRRYAEHRGTVRHKLEGLLRFPGFDENVKAYAVVHDADRNAHDTLTSVQNALKDLGAPCPNASGVFASDSLRKVGILILPPDAESGCLEDVCLGTVMEHPVMPCVDAFMECLASSCEAKPGAADRDAGRAFFPKHESKARAQAFMAGLYESPHEVGRAAQKGYWPFDAPGIEPIVRFLKELRA